MCCRRRSAAARRVAGVGRRGPGRGGGARGAAAAPGCSTLALRQAAARAHLPAAAPGRVIGCPRRAREIELSIHSWAGRARSAAAELSRRALGDVRCLPPSRRRVLAQDVGAHGRRAAGCSCEGCECRGLSFLSRRAQRCILEAPQLAVPGVCSSREAGAKL